MEIIFCRCFVIVILIERQLYLHTGELNYLTLSRKKIIMGPLYPVYTIQPVVNPVVQPV